jgi:hypothetical protein
VQVSTLIKRAFAVGAGIMAMAVITAAPASAASKDRNHDNIPDRWEVKHGLSLNKNQARRDQDRDGLANRGEFQASFDPQDADTDDDTVEDGDEGAGTVGSFTTTDGTTGTLVINLFGGGTVTGEVTADTEIDCHNDDADQPDDESDDGPDDDSDDVGDDDPADDVGDDQGDDGPGHDRVSRSNGSDSHHSSDEGDDDQCTAADLTPGTVVQEADLELTATGLVFDEIEL